MAGQGDSARGGRSRDTGEDAEWEKWWGAARKSVGEWGSFDAIENFTDDDDWGGREPLGNFFVSRHDATQEGAVDEGTIAIYRLSESVSGCSWGVGRVVAMQVRYSIHGPNGAIHLQPLMLADDPGAGGMPRLVEDPGADIAMVRVIDRFEVLDQGLESLPDGSVRVWEDTSGHARVIASGMVHLGGSGYEWE